MFSKHFICRIGKRKSALAVIFCAITLLCANANASTNVVGELTPWSYNHIGPTTGDAQIQVLDSEMTYSVSDVCLPVNQFKETFTGNDASSLSNFGFSVEGNETFSLLNNVGVVSNSLDGVTLAPTVFKEGSNFTVSAKVHTDNEAGYTNQTPTLYFFGGSYQFGVFYEGDNASGYWKIARFTSTNDYTVVSSVVASGNMPSTEQLVSVHKSNSVLNVKVNGSDIGLSYSLSDEENKLTRYGLRSNAATHYSNSYVDDLTLSFTSEGECPALVSVGDWDDAYSVNYIHQQLLNTGSVVTRLSNHTNPSSGVAGIVLRDGVEQQSKSVALVISPIDSTIKMHTRESSELTNTTTSTGSPSAMPQWLKMNRSGNSVTAFISADGNSWTQVGTAEISFSSIINAGIALAIVGTDNQVVTYDNLLITNELSGSIPADLTLPKNQKYTITGDVTVPEGVALNIPEGAKLAFNSNTQLIIDGQLNVEGTLENPVEFYSSNASPSKGVWDGIQINSTGTLSFEYAQVEHADYGILFKNANGQVSNSLFQNNTYGLYVEGNSSPDITGIVATENSYGLRINSSSTGKPQPVITQSEIHTNSSYGFYIYGSRDALYDPAPVINNNSIYDNASNNVYTYYFGDGANTTIDAKNNWWGTENPDAIDDKIQDHSDSASNYYPWVDFSGFKDAANGNPVVENSLMGIPQNNTHISGNQTLIGDLIIAEGSEVTIDAGTIIKVVKNHEIVVNGTLNISGTADSLVRFLSNMDSPAKGDWDGIVVNSGGTINVEYALIEHADEGIYFNNANGAVTNSILQNNTYGIYMVGNSNPVITGIEATANTYGIRINGNSGGKPVPIVTQSKIHTNSSYGFYIYGARNTAHDPEPVINHNSIYDNGSHNFYTYYYADGASVTLDAKNNWWGSADPDVIDDKIYDHSDSNHAYYPWVDFSGFKDSADGSAVALSTMMGIPADRANISGEHTLIGDLIIAADTTVTLTAGTILNVVEDHQIIVNGTLNIAGTADNVVKLISNKATPVKGDWNGITVNSTGTVNANFVQIEDADYGIYFKNSNGSVANSSFKNSSYGIRMTNSSIPVSNTVVQNNNYGFYIEGNSDPVITGVTASANTQAFYIRGNSGGKPEPVITQSDIYGNTSYGINAYGARNALYDPAPVINHNSIYDNGSYNFYTYYYADGASVTLDAKNNWWGSADPDVIDDKIYDYSDSNNAYYPWVDFSGFKDAADGSAVLINGLVGVLADGDNITGESTLVGDLIIATDTTVTLTAGTILNVVEDHQIIVDGTLNIAGTADNVVKLISNKATPAKGDWYGITVNSTGTLNANFVQIEDAEYGIYFKNSNGSVANSSFKNSSYGIRMTNSSIPVSNTVVQNNNYGFYIEGNSDPVITGVTATANTQAFYIRGNSGGKPEPVITQSDIYGNTSYGINAYGARNALYDPAPVINHNSIYDNGSHNFYTYYYADGASVTLDAKNNWWGSADPDVIDDKIYDYSDGNGVYYPWVDFSGFKDAIDGAPVLSNSLMGIPQDAANISGEQTLIGDLIIAADTTVTLAAGTILNVVEDHQIIVNGTLHIAGTEESYVKLVSYKETPQKGDWYGILVNSTGAVNINYAQIEHADYGVHFKNASGTVINSIVKNNSYGLYIEGNSDPEVTKIVSTENNQGIYIYGNNAAGKPEPVITQSTIFNNVTYGINVRGNRNVAYDPVPIINYNNIYDNGNQNLYTYYYVGGADVILDAKFNWWGSVDPDIIDDKIYDFSDTGSNYYPSVDFDSFLDGIDGKPVVSNNLKGIIEDGTTLTGEQTLVGDIIISEGTTVSIDAGTVFNVVDGYEVVVDGTLAIQGTLESPVIFQSKNETPKAGDWDGITVNSTGTLNASYLEVEHADYGIYFKNSNGSVSNSAFRNNTYGIRLTNSSAPITNTVVQGNTYGIYLEGDSDPALTNVTASTNTQGIYIRGTNGGKPEPVITQSQIHSNTSYGIHVYGTRNTEYDPAPVINHNSIYDNGSNNLYAYYFIDGSTVTLNAQNNWWGSVDPDVIDDKIYDYSDSNNDYSPWVDFGGFKDSADGTAVVANSLMGIPQDAANISGEHTLIGDLIIAADTTVTLAASTILNVVEDHQIIVNGTLNIVGTSDNVVKLISDKATPAKGDWYGILVNSTGTVNVDYVQIEHADYGIYFKNANGTVTNSSFLNSTNGLYIEGNSDPVITNINVSANTYGIYIRGTNGGKPEPVITQSEIFSNTSYGIHVYGARNTEYDPAPVINHNSIFDNASYNFYSYYYADGSSVTLDAKNNWWGSTDPDVIDDKIYDYSDSNNDYNPWVDFGGFKDSADGTAVVANSLMGIPQDAANISGEHTLIGDLIIAADTTVTLAAGTILNVVEDHQIIVNGTLNIVGTSDNIVKLISDKATPDKGDWYGILVNSTGTVNVDYVQIEHADYGIRFKNTNGTVTNSSLLNSTYGLYIEGNSDPVITNITASENNQGIYIVGTNLGKPEPVITQSDIYSNISYGINVRGSNNETYDPLPVFNHNSIYDNGTYNLYTYNYADGSSVTLDAKNNWWGSTDPDVIDDKIYDHSDGNSVYVPWVDFSGFKSAADGTAVAANSLMGIPQDAANISGEQTLIGDLIIAADTTVTLAAGTILNVVEDHQIIVNGTLNIVGTSDNIVKLISDKATPAKGDWYGILVNSTGTVNVDYVQIEHADYGIHFKNANGTVTNSTFQNNSYGLYIEGNSDPVISNIISTGNNDGIYINGNSSLGIPEPVITESEIFSNTSYGINVRGSRNVAYDPLPVINNNSIYDNASYNLYAYYYADGSSVTLDAKNNWWGSTDPDVIDDKIYDHSDGNSVYVPWVDFSGFKSAADGTAVIANSLMGIPQDAANISGAQTLIGDLIIAADTTVTIAAGTILNVVEDHQIIVNGTLNIVGTSDNVVKLISGKATPAKGDWYGILVNSTGTVNVDYVQIEHADYGIHFKNANGTVTNSSFLNSTYGLYIEGNSDPVITNITATENSQGIYIYGNTNLGVPEPVITQSQIHGNTSYGINIRGSKNVDYDPSPVINHNGIYDNDSYNLYVGNYANGMNVLVDAKYNWWGSADPDVIDDKIYDHSDGNNIYVPWVDFTGFKNSVSGSSVVENALFGYIQDGAVLSGEYTVIGDIIIESGSNVTIQPGTQLRMVESHLFNVAGSLVIQGSEDAFVSFVPDSAGVEAGLWAGLKVLSGGSLDVNYAQILGAQNAILADSPTVFSIKNSVISDYSAVGIQVSNSDDRGLIQSTLINGKYGYTVGIKLTNASPRIENNTISSQYQAIHLYGNSNPLITGNTISNSNYGIYLDSQYSDDNAPQPVITANDFSGINSYAVYMYRFQSDSSIVLNAQGNWWGSADATIESILYQGSSTASIDISNQLSEPSKPGVTSVSMEYHYISPNGDGVQDATDLNASFSGTYDWALSLNDTTGKRVYNQSGNGNSIAVNLGGLNSEGQALPEGQYFVYLNLDGTTVSNTWIVIDRTDPTVGISSLVDQQYIYGNTVVTGDAYDQYMAGYSVEYKLNTSEEWVLLNSDSSSIYEGPLANWVLQNNDGILGLPPGAYDLRVSVVDLAGNKSAQTILINANALSIYDITPSNTVFDHGETQTVSLAYSINQPATVTMTIKSQQTLEEVYSTTTSYTEAGTYFVSWDGKDSQGQYVDEAAYIYTLSGLSDISSNDYDPDSPNSAGFPGSVTVVSEMDMYAGKPMISDLKTSFNNPVLLSVEIRRSEGNFYIVQDEPVDTGETYRLIWDGRDLDGNFVEGTYTVWYHDTKYLPSNVFIVRGVSPDISGTAPSIAVLSDPYLINHSYDQFTKVAFELDQDSLVTFKLLPPNVVDPNSSAAITLKDGELLFAKAGLEKIAHEITWKGYEDSNTNNIQMSDEGVYSFWIEAVSNLTGKTSTYYGALQAYQ